MTVTKELSDASAPYRRPRRSATTVTCIFFANRTTRIASCRLLKNGNRDPGGFATKICVTAFLRAKSTNASASSSPSRIRVSICSPRAKSKCCSNAVRFSAGSDAIPGPGVTQTAKQSAFK